MTEFARQHYSFEEYVELEDLSPVRHEFLGGHVWAMVGGTPEHAAITASVVALLNVQLRSRPCRVFTSDLRIRVKSTGLATYPDASVVCDELQLDPEDHKGHSVMNPKVLIEVLSPSTEHYDRGEKLVHYQSIESLDEVVLVAQDERRIDVWRRGAQGWGVTTWTEGAALLHSIDCALELDDVYRNPLARH